MYSLAEASLKKLTDVLAECLRGIGRELHIEPAGAEDGEFRVAPRSGSATAPVRLNQGRRAPTPRLTAPEREARRAPTRATRMPKVG